MKKRLFFLPSLVVHSLFFFIAISHTIKAEDPPYFPISHFWNTNGSSITKGILLDSIPIYEDLYKNVLVSYTDSCILKKITYAKAWEPAPGNLVTLDFSYSQERMHVDITWENGDYAQYTIDNKRRIRSENWEFSTNTASSSASKYYSYANDKLVSYGSSGFSSSGVGYVTFHETEEYLFNTDGNLSSKSIYSHKFDAALGYDTTWAELVISYNGLKKINSINQIINSRRYDEGAGEYYSRDTTIIETVYTYLGGNLSESIESRVGGNPIEKIEYDHAIDTTIISEFWENDLWAPLPSKWLTTTRYSWLSNGWDPKENYERAYDDDDNLIHEIIYHFDNGTFKIRSITDYNYDNNKNLLHQISYRVSNEIPYINRSSYQYDLKGNVILKEFYKYDAETQTWISELDPTWQYNCLGALIKRRVLCEPKGITESQYFYYIKSKCSQDDFYEEEVKIEICKGENHNGYTESGSYQEWSCGNEGDSLFQINLAVNPTYDIFREEEICPGEEYLGYNEAGIYVQEYSTSLGCDSIEQIEIIVLDEVDPDCKNNNYNELHTILEDFRIVPNPTNETISLTNLDDSKIFELSIYSISGNLQLQTDYITRKAIDISNFPNGLYMVKFQDNNNFYSKKFLKID